jgi:uncharacterized protein with HEPN domain
MNRSDLDRLRDARNFARDAIANAEGLSAEVLAEARQSQHAAFYDLVIIGETLGKISGEVKSAAPHIQWRKITDLRNILVHAYWQVDLEVIAGVIQNRLAPLIEDLSRLIYLVEHSEK